MFYFVNYLVFLAIDLLALTKTSIQNLFDSSTNSTRLARPSGAVSISQAIDAASNSLDQLQGLSLYSNETLSLTQSLDFAKGLQMLTPFFTDISMSTPVSSNPINISMSAINSSINALNISSQNLQILNDLMASVGSAAQSRVFHSNYTILVLA